MLSETTPIKLLKQEDWPAWFDFIRSEATAAKIWRFVNPDEENPPINVEPDMLYYIKDRAITSTPSSTATAQSTQASPSTSTSSEPSPDPDLEKCLAGLDTAGRLNVYKVKLAQYEREVKSLATLSKLIRTTVGPNFVDYLFNEHVPHKLLRTLQRVAKPSRAALRQLIESDFERVNTGPKHLGIEAWLNLYIKISKKAEQVDDPPYEATTPYLIRHLIQSSHMVNPSFHAAYSQPAEEGTLKFNLEELISKFNISYKPPKGRRAAFPALAGESTDNPPSATTDDRQRQNECLACGGFHSVKRCRNLFEELRPDGWVVSDARERRCHNYLKTPEGKELYQQQKKHFAAHPPEKPTLKPSSTKRKASQDPESPQLSAAAAFLPPPQAASQLLPQLLPQTENPSAALSIRELDDIDLSTSWTYDTGANTHVGNDIEDFIDYEEVQPTHMATGSSSSAIHGYGDIKLSIRCGKRTRTFTLKHVAHCPGFHTNLVCGDILFDAGVKIDQEANCLIYRKTGGRFADLIRHDKFRLLKAHAYKTPTAYAANSKEVFNKLATRKVWHQRLGHCDMESIEHLPVAAEGVELREEPQSNTVFGPPLCEPCIMARIQKQKSRKPALRGTYPFEGVHFDVIILGTKGKKAYDGSTCIAHFWCDHTKYHRAWPLPNHQQATLLPIFESIIAFAKKFGPGIKWLHSDDEQGIGDKIEALLEADGIIWEMSPPYTPDQNGAAERSGRTITDRGRAILDEALLPILLWPELTYAVIYLLNRTPIRSLGWKTPYEMLYGVKPRLFGLRVLGSLTYVLIQPEERRDTNKFDPRALRGYLVGFEASNIYRVWIPATNRVLRTRDVRIDETARYKPPQPEATEITVQEKDEMNRIQDLVDIMQTNEFDWIEDLEAIPSVPVQTIQTEKSNNTTHLITPPATPDELVPYEAPDFNLNQEQPPFEPILNEGRIPPAEALPSSSLGGGEPEEPGEPEPSRESQSSRRSITPEPMPQRRSKRRKTRTHKADEMPDQDLRRRAFYAENSGLGENPNIYDESAPHVHLLHAFHAATTRNFGHRDDLPPEPKSWKAMMNHPMSAHFRAAAHKEIRTLIAKHTWDEVARPTQGTTNILPTKWVFEYKADTDGYVTRCKARLCARGDLQLGVNKHDVAAITGAYRTFRLLMALVAAFDLDVIQLDAVNAFINADLDEDVYITCPEGYKEAGRDICLKLRKALYGLRKSPKLWYIELSTTLRKLGLTPVPDEPCLFIHPTKLIMVFFYVDDILLIGANHLNSDLEALSQNLMDIYETRRMVEFKSFLGTTVLRDRPNKRLWLYQDQYIEKLVAIYHQEFAPQARTPLSGQDLKEYEGQATPNQIIAYQRRIGSVIYPASTLRPDIAFAASRLAEFMQNPSPAHLSEAHRVIAYLYGTRYHAIEYSSITPYQNTKTLRIASDASFADDNATRRSTQGYLVKLFNGPIIWQSSKQKTVSTSTTEAELLALSHVGKEVQHMARIFKAIRFDAEQNTEIECDNQQAVRIVSSKEPTMTTKLRHVDIHQFWLRQEVQSGKFTIQWVPTAEMMADGLTKPLSKQAHQNFLELLGLRDIRHRLTPQTP